MFFVFFDKKNTQTDRKYKQGQGNQCQNPGFKVEELTG